ncbi:MAG: zinc-dependent alcohol dehydrogenase family protein [Chloroflexi bacterium]|nr:MAG: zinc-dependent alcohol dehydrogenase family protein [Chloroflexota bacterium]
MQAMLLERATTPLRLTELPTPEPGPGEVRLDVAACAVCRTDLHVVDGELTEPKLPLIVGHQIVGRVGAIGSGVDGLHVGDRVGVPWLAYVDGTCEQCRAGRENLCVNARFTGYTVDGGYAEQTVARADACLRIPERYSDVEAAPLLCAGLIGYRAYRFTGDGPRLGLYGFGDAAHILTQVARHQGRRVFAFTRANDAETQRFALSLGAEWAGDALGPSPEPLDAAIIFAPVGELVPAALRAVGPGGIVVCAGIHMSDIPSFPYAVLWQERVLRSVANLTRNDATEFLRIAPQVPVRTAIEVLPLAAANDALASLRAGRVHGAAVLAAR